MKKKISLKEEMIKELKKVIKKNPEYDFAASEMKSKKVLDEVKWKSKTKSGDDMLVVMRAYQRVARIVPKEKPDVAVALLEKGIHSALQVAAVPEHKFIKEHQDLFKTKEDEKVAKEIHKRALIKRSQLVVQYMNWKQSNEPHVKAARV